VQHRGHTLGEPQASIDLSQQQQPPIAGDRAPAEIHLQLAARKLGKLNLIRSTICHRRILRNIGPEQLI
jgi:hypothetical protein